MTWAMNPSSLRGLLLDFERHRMGAWTTGSLRCGLGAWILLSDPRFPLSLGEEWARGLKDSWTQATGSQDRILG